LGHRLIGEELCAGHGSTSRDEHIRNDAPAGKALTEGRESLLQLGPAEHNIARVAHVSSSPPGLLDQGPMSGVASP